MTVWIATRTLAAIENALVADGGNTYRRYLKQVLPSMTDAYRDAEDGYRTHLGASVVAQACARAVAYSYHWAVINKQRAYKRETKNESYARSLRIWNRGHLEEGRFIALLLAAGIRVYQQDAEGKQFRISYYGGHFGGSCDGVALGIPDLPFGIPALTEYKTHNSKSFTKLQEEGLMAAKPEHYGQMQVYMGSLGLQYGVYIAVNKDTDELYAEIITYAGEVTQYYLERARDIIFNDDDLPPRIRGASPGFYVCKYMCDFKDVCFHTVPVAKNCRTCEHSRAQTDGSWVCTVTGQLLDKEMQKVGCELYATDERML